MSRFDLSSLLTVPDDTATRLDAFLRRGVEEVCSWRRDLTAYDGSSMEACRDAVEARASEILHVGTLASAAAEIASILIPLADSVREADAALREVGAWVEALCEGSTADDVLSVLAAARDTRLLELTHADFADDDGRAAYDAAMEYYLAMADRAVCKLSLSGRAATVVLDEEGLVLAAQIQGDEWALVCLISNQESGDGGWGWGGDGPDPEPEPESDPTRPELVGA